MTVLGSVLENLSVLAAAAMVLFFLGLRWAPGEMSRTAVLTVGLLFGAASALVILVALKGPAGANVDTRAGPILVATYLYGPLAGAVSAAIAGVARYAVGGPFQITGALSPFVYFLAGLVFHRLWRGRSSGPLCFAALALVGSAFAAPALFVGVGPEAGLRLLTEFWPALIVVNVVGTLLLGLLVERFRAVMFQQRQTDAVLAHAGDGILTLDEGDRVLAANPAALRILDRSARAVEGAPIDALLRPQQEEPTARLDSPAGMASALAGLDDPHAIAVVAQADGRRRRLSYSRTPFTVAGRRRSTVVLRDLTELLDSRAELQRMMGELAAQLQATAKANQSKSLFLANMSHELRTPLNAILGFTDLIAAVGPDKIPRAKLEEYLADINASGRVLLRLVDTVMDINRIERGDAGLALEAVELKRWLANFVRIMSIELGRDQRLTIVGDGRTYPALCDPTALTQCLGNLVSNALKHGDWGVTVTLSLAERDGRVALCVADDGPGVPDAVLHRLGEPFVRGDAALRRSVPGVGLGLAITKRLIEEQGGSFTLVRRDEGGTCAEIQLRPAEPAPGAERPATG